MNTWDAYGVTVREWLIPKTMTRIRPGRRFPNGKAKTQTIHETANYNPGVNALATVRYLHNGAEGRTVSYHCAVDDREGIVALPFAEHGWHAGDGAGPGNYTSFAIEICVNSDGDFDKAIDNAARFSAWLYDNGHGVEGIVQHNHWSGKHCPRLIRDRGLWSRVMALCAQYRGGVTLPPKGADMGMTEKERAGVDARFKEVNERLWVLGNLVAGHGLHDRDGKLLTREAAIAHADGRGISAIGSVQSTQRELGVVKDAIATLTAAVDELTPLDPAKLKRIGERLQEIGKELSND